MLNNTMGDVVGKVQNVENDRGQTTWFIPQINRRKIREGGEI